MSAAEALRVALEKGVCNGVEGSDLILDADREPTVDVLDAIRRHKAEIVALLAASKDGWSADDWRVFFDERAAIAEHDGGLSRSQAETQAFECSIAAWLNQNPEPSNPDRCAWCHQKDETGHAIVPLGTNSRGHTWLHPDCWSLWYEHRRSQGEKALADMGVRSNNGGDS